MIKDKHQYHVCGWMINQLHLDGRELQCYAIIYSLSQLGEGRYIAGLKFLAEFMQCTQPTASSAIKGLFDKGLIKKDETVTENGRRVFYYCADPDIEEGCINNPEGCKNNSEGVNKKFMDGVNKKFMPKYNIEENKKEINKRLSNDNPKKEYSEDFEIFWKLYRYSKNKGTAYSRWNHLSKADREKAVKAIQPYFEDCARHNRSKQHPATYLSKRTFEDDFTQNDRIRFYDALDGDSDEKKRFKEWMRNTHPEIENTALPLSYEDYMDIVGKNYERVYLVNTILDDIDANIYMYRRSDIASVIRKKVTEEGEDE